MKIIIKGIRGGTCTLDVQESTTVTELKQRIESNLDIPAAQQTLVLFGKTLQDDKTIGFYPKIKEGTKVYVAVKKQETLDMALSRYLHPFYSEQQCKTIVNEFMNDFHNKVSNLSLDDLERIAKADMEQAAG